jgi:hypothetical protein
MKTTKTKLILAAIYVACVSLIICVVSAKAASPDNVKALLKVAAHSEPI